MPTAIVHVEPNASGRWIVRHENDLVPLSEHESATEAEHAARGLTLPQETPVILLHDRYARVHRL